MGDLKSSAKELIETSLSNTSAIIQIADERAALKNILKRILDDLPQNRDWLDPDLEKVARELVK